jgi:hypothetical protein
MRTYQRVTARQREALRRLMSITRWQELKRDSLGNIQTGERTDLLVGLSAHGLVKATNIFRGGWVSADFRITAPPSYFGRPNAVSR